SLPGAGSRRRSLSRNASPAARPTATPATAITIPTTTGSTGSDASPNGAAPWPLVALERVGECCSHDVALRFTVRRHSGNASHLSCIWVILKGGSRRQHGDWTDEWSGMRQAFQDELSEVN